MLNRIVLNGADDRFIHLLSRDLTEEEMQAELDLTPSEFTLLVKEYYERFAANTLHGLLAKMLLHGGKVKFYSMKSLPQS